MKAAPSSCRVSTKRMSLRPCISVTILLVVEPTTPKVYSTPSARNASRTAWPAFMCHVLGDDGWLPGSLAERYDAHQQSLRTGSRRRRHDAFAIVMIRSDR